MPSIPTKRRFLRFTFYHDIICEIAATKTKNTIRSYCAIANVTGYSFNFAYAQLESDETVFEACSNSTTTWARPVTPTFRFAHSTPELRVSLCAAVPIERVLYRLSSENGAVKWPHLALEGVERCDICSNYWYYVQYFVLVKLCMTAHVQQVVVPYVKKDNQ